VTYRMRTDAGRFLQQPALLATPQTFSLAVAHCKRRLLLLAASAMTLGRFPGCSSPLFLL